MRQTLFGILGAVMLADGVYHVANGRYLLAFLAMVSLIGTVDLAPAVPPVVAR